MIGYWFFVKGCRLDRILVNDPGYRVLQVSLAFIPSPIFAARETCSKLNYLQEKTSLCNWKEMKGLNDI